MQKTNGIYLYRIQSHSKQCNEDPELGKEDQQQGHDCRIAEFAGRAVIHFVDRFVHYIKIVGGNNVVFDKLITEVKIKEGKIQNIYGDRQIKARVEMEKVEKEKQDLHPVRNDVDLCSKDSLLFEGPGNKSVEHIAKPVNAQSYKIVSFIPLHKGKNKKGQRADKPYQGDHIGHAVDTLRIFGV